MGHVPYTVLRARLVLSMMRWYVAGIEAEAPPLMPTGHLAETTFYRRGIACVQTLQLRLRRCSLEPR